MQLAANQTQPFAAAPALAICWTEMVSHRKDLVRFARRRLQDPMLAEDVVHDVFEAVLSGRAAFAGRSALRSWLTAVLKNKIVDLVRQRAGIDSLEQQNDADGVLTIACPQPGPHEAAEQRELLAQTLARIDALPAPLRDVMQLRVLQDQPTEAVCKTLAITPDNLFVRLHRARAQLLN
ncbi:MAG: sigma-70 family RNA polymerase sigma factor [Burkholderiaceae bacterium]